MIVNVRRSGDPRSGRTGTCGQMSWYRFAETLRLTGELKPHETIVAVDVDEEWIRYFVRSDL